MRPRGVGMQYFFQLNPVWGQIMAYGTLITLPVLIIFVLFPALVRSVVGRYRRQRLSVVLNEQIMGMFQSWPAT